MTTVWHIVAKVVPWIGGITLIGLVIYSVSRVMRYWGSDSWTLTSGTVESYADMLFDHVSRVRRQ